MTQYSEIIPTRPGHYVYRLWAADGTCLYVGLVGQREAGRISDRFWMHKRDKPWWPEVASIDAATFSNPSEVVTEEKLQIASLEPFHHKQLRKRCVRGHDLTLPGAMYEGRHCRQCQRDADAAPARKARKRARERARRVLRSARCPSPSQAGLW